MDDRDYASMSRSSTLDDESADRVLVRMHVRELDCDHVHLPDVWPTPGLALPRQTSIAAAAVALCWYFTLAIGRCTPLIPRILI